MTLHQLFNFLIPEERRPLGALILLSLMIHFGAFFIFKSKPYYPKTIKIIPPKASLIQLNTSSSSANTTAWVDLFDPSVIALPSKESDSNFSKKLSPRLSDVLPTLESPVPLIPTQTELVNLPDTLPSLAERATQSIYPSRPSPTPLSVETPPALRGTEVQITGALSKREILHREPLPQIQSTLTLLRPTILRIAVDDQGVAAHVLVDESCGDSSADALAIQALKNWRFAALDSKKSLQWGRITVFWDIQPPSPTPTEKSAP